MMGRWDDGGWGAGGWVAMALMMLVFWTVVVAVVIVLVRGTGHSHVEQSSGAPRPDPALQILEERFARGEIDAAEYTQRRDLLRPG